MLYSVSLNQNNVMDIQEAYLDQLHQNREKENNKISEAWKDKFVTPDYYNNDKGSLYKIASERNWNAYTFDVIKRLDRGGKKDPLRQEIEKSIVVLELWLKELE